MRMTTVQGNRRTTPVGIEILELPRRRSLCRKNDNLDVCLLIDRDSTFTGRVGE
jgi:hypothetical protein